VRYLRGQFTRGRDQLTSVIERIFQWIEAANQERGDAERVIFGQRLRYLRRSANECR
jgi:hypothetical protein